MPICEAVMILENTDPISAHCANEGCALSRRRARNAAGLDTRPQEVASLFKISHHGSANGHHDGIWTTMLINGPMAVLTPWTLGGSDLPQPGDVQRIGNLTPNAYSTSRLTAPGLQWLPQAARRTIREAQIKIRQIEPPTGFIRLRTDASSPLPSVWALTASQDAVRLS
jgi:hypothetical protein